MNQKLIIPILCCLLLCGCDSQIPPEQNYYIQQIAHLHLENTLEEVTEKTPVRAVWIPFLIYEHWMHDRSETQFRETVRQAFQNCADFGLNTVFLHVRAYCDAYYQSDLFPKGAYLTQNYDPLAIMLEEAHALNLSAHAWINPMRGQTEQQISALDQKYLLRQWYDQKNGSYLVNQDGRYYLNPAYSEVRQLIADGITEIINHYDVDGIHIDDYFYPTTSPEFDQQAFSESNLSDLSEFRRQNCSALVKLLYQTMKEHHPDMIFSISPQGNFQINYDQLYADVKLWSTEPGYCDMIIPQIYYGFENAVCPFAETAQAWADLVTIPELVIGLGVYKIGLSDQWAGKGKSEWLTDSTVISRQLEFVSELENADGIAFYSYSSLFEPDQAVSALINDQKQQIHDLIQKNSAPDASGAES